MKYSWLYLALLLVPPAVSANTPVRSEHVGGGAMDLTWQPAFGGPTLLPVTSGPADPTYSNPSGDHTIGVLTTLPPDQGGIAVSVTDTEGLADYRWEAWIFTGEGNSRRGLIVRADPGNAFQSHYHFVLQQGMLQLAFRRLVNGAPTTLASWFTTSTPGGFPAVNSWHHMAVEVRGDEFHCWWDGTQLTTTPIVDSSIGSGFVGVYNFRFDIGGIPVYLDDLVLSRFEDPIAITPTSWSRIKSLSRSGRP